jgi:hypothetical protein
MTLFQQDSRINRLEIAKENVLIGILILIGAYFIDPLRNLGERTSLYVSIPLSAFFIVAWILKAFTETIILRVDINEQTGNLQITTNMHFKEDQKLEFSVNSLTLTEKTYPSRTRPADKKIILSDNDKQIKINLRGHGIGKENFEYIVNKLKENYPQQWRA